MSPRHKDERPGLPPEPFDNHSHNVIDFATARNSRKGPTVPGAELHGLSECRLLAALQSRFARFNTGVYPLDGDKLLLSQVGGFTRVLPDLRAAHHVVRQWEGVA